MNEEENAGQNSEIEEQGQFSGVDIKGNDARMRFRNSKDPIYVAYNYVDNQPLKKVLAGFFSELISIVQKGLLGKK